MGSRRRSLGRSSCWLLGWSRSRLGSRSRRGFRSGSWSLCRFRRGSGSLSGFGSGSRGLGRFRSGSWSLGRLGSGSRSLGRFGSGGWGRGGGDIKEHRFSSSIQNGPSASTENSIVVDSSACIGPESVPVENCGDIVRLDPTSELLHHISDVKLGRSTGVSSLESKFGNPERQSLAK